jgi:predicted ferric reductase
MDALNGIATLAAWFAPGIDDPLTRGRAVAFGILIFALTATAIGLPVFWKFTKDLERWTVFAAGGLIAVFGGLLWLSRAGFPEWSAAILAILLLAFCIWDIFSFSAASVGGTAIVLPILLLSFGVHPVGGVLAALTGSAAVWVCALGERAGWPALQAARHRDHWTFHAPALTTLFVLTATLAVFWSAYLAQAPAR